MKWPHKFEDMCDKLAGKYPKDFKFTGWHPHCRCYATSILKTDDEIAEDTRKMLAGEAIKIKQGKRMTFKEADSGHAPPHYSWLATHLGIVNEYNVNCTLTVAAHELRMRGWDVEAKGLDVKNDVMRKMKGGAYNTVWIDPGTGQPPEKNTVWAKNSNIAVTKIEKATEQVGRYHISVHWLNGLGHVFCIDRLPDGTLRIYDPQDNTLNIIDWLKEVNLKKGIGILKVDGMLINPSVVKHIVQSVHLPS